MLTGFRVQNFKAFEDTMFIELKPLTLLSGINSAGKSSILQALLLLKQTLESGGAHLTPVGPLLEQTLGGNFTDFVFMRPDPSDAALTYRLMFTYEPEEKLLFKHLSAFIFEKPQDMVQPLTVMVEITFIQGQFGSRSREAVRVKILETVGLLPRRDLIGLRVRHQAVSDSYSVEFIKDKTDKMLQDLAVEQLEVSLAKDFLPQFLGVDRWAQQDALRDIPQSFVEFWRELFRLVQFDLSDNISYLSSFRESPLRAYAKAAIKESSYHGADFAFVLWARGRDKVSFVNQEGKLIKSDLRGAVRQVLVDILGLDQYKGVQEIDVGQIAVRFAPLGFASKSQEDKDLLLSEVGLGYNQILPVIVHGLLTPPGGLVIFEQPEIHLHPDVQAKLVQFFVGLAKAGRRVLVETHSSHMIEHLCLEIAQDDTNWLAQNAQTLFIHAPDATHKSARIETIEITPYGEILNWPPYFLPDVAALDEEIIRAGFARQQKERETSA
ncbi:MAG: AAA family ATPase [Chloroflexota bacterium]|nr:AAA family ATPase [Chloroflexota bacterium]